MLLTFLDLDDFLDAARVRTLVASDIVRFFCSSVAVEGFVTFAYSGSVLKFLGEGSFNDLGLAKYFGEAFVEGGLVFSVTLWVL